MRSGTIRSCTNMLFLAALLNLSACGKDAPTAGSGTPAGTSAQAGTKDQRGGYMDLEGWTKVRALLKNHDAAVDELGEFYTIWGWAQQHRAFYRYKEAIATVPYLYPKLGKIVQLARTMQDVAGWPQLAELREGWIRVATAFSNASWHLRIAFVAMRDGNKQVELRESADYGRWYREGCRLSLEKSRIWGELTTRGGRTASQNLTGIQTHDGDTIPKFRVLLHKVGASYRATVAASQSAFALVEQRGDHAGMLRVLDDLYTAMQKLIMEASWLTTGDLKSLWDAKDAVMTMLSSRMGIAMQHKAWLLARKAGDAAALRRAQVVLDITKQTTRDAEQAFQKLRF